MLLLLDDFIFCFQHFQHTKLTNQINVKGSLEFFER